MGLPETEKKRWHIPEPQPISIPAFPEETPEKEPAVLPVEAPVQEPVRVPA